MLNVIDARAPATKRLVRVRTTPAVRIQPGDRARIPVSTSADSLFAGAMLAATIAEEGWAAPRQQIARDAVAIISAARRIPKRSGPMPARFGAIADRYLLIISLIRSRNGGIRVRFPDGRVLDFTAH